MSETKEEDRNGDYSCELCDKSYVNKASLKRHLSTARHQAVQQAADAGKTMNDLKEERKSCTVCNKTFSTRQACTLHFRSSLHKKRELAQQTIEGDEPNQNAV